MKIKKFLKVTIAFSFLITSMLISIGCSGINKAEKTFIDYFVWNYFVAYQRLENIESELKILKKMFNRVFFKSLDNKFISLKEKLTLVILYLSPKLYNKLILNREL